MNKLYILIFLLISTRFSLVAQTQTELSEERTINLSGEIINAEGGESVPYVHIINKNTNQGTTSDLSGKFSIAISQTDTVIFSAVGFEKYSLTLVDNEVSSNHYFIRILLDPATYELSPVNIYAFKDEAAFKQEILNLKIPESTNPKIIIPGSYNGPRRDLTGKFSISSPISAIQGLFSKEVKEIRKYREVLKTYPQQKLIHEKYNREIVEKITGLKDKDLNEFMLFCKIPDDYIIKANEYEIVLAVNDCYKDFLQSRN